MKMNSEWFQGLLGGQLDAAELAVVFPHAQELRETPQDSLYHAEGDVWTHTMMVLARVEEIARTEDLPLLRAAALLHDIAKPETTVHEFCEKEQRMRVRQPNHAAKGRDKAWRLLTDIGADAALKREICEIVAWHQRPSHLPDQNNIENRILRYSALGLRWRPLLDLCRSDNLGRISPNVAEAVEALDLVSDEVERIAREIGTDLLDAAPSFTGERVRYLYGAHDASIYHDPWTETPGPTLHLFTGLPASGKTSMRGQIDADVVSIDDVRAGVKRFKHGDPEDEGRVIRECQSLLRQALAKGRDVIWDATCLTRQNRGKVIRLADAYGARTTIWSFEDPAEVCAERNRNRGDRAMVPTGAFERMASNREAVGRDEAHEVRIVLDGRVFEPAPEVQETACSM